MKISALNALATCLVAANAIQIWKRPTVEDAAVNARTLIHRESLANINTVYQDGDDKGLPASFVEYYADCGDGNPVILAINMATSFKNIQEGSPYSLTVRVGDHSPHEHVNPKYPGSRPHSVAGSPRINLRGNFIDVQEEEVEELKKCFLKRHKDAVWWLPGNPIHESHFVKFDVKDAYFLGGFGDTGYIGKIPKDLYSKASPIEDDKEETEHFIKAFKEENHDSNWGYDAYMTHFTIKKQIHSLYKKVDDELALLKSLLSEEQENNETHESNGVSTELIEVVKRQLFKRDEQAPLQAQEDLTTDQVKKLITELETLRSDIHKYGKAMLDKFSGESKEVESKHPKQIEGAKHHKFNKHHRGPRFLKKLSPGDYKSEDIFMKHHPDAKHVPEFLKGKTLRVVDSSDDKPGFYSGEEYYKGKNVDGPIPDKVYVTDNHHDESKEAKGGKHNKFAKGEHHDEERKAKCGDFKRFKGKHHKFEKDGDVESHSWKDHRRNREGSADHHKQYKHHPEPKQENALHEVEAPGLFSGLAHIFDFFKGTEPESHGHEEEEKPRIRHGDFKQRRPKNVKFESDLEHDFENIAN